MKKKRQYKKASVIVALGMLMAVCMMIGCKKPVQRELVSNKKSAEQAAESEPPKSPSPDPILAEDQLDSETVLITAPEETPAARSLIADDGLCIADRIETPEGFTRILEEEGSFGEFVREYPLLPNGSPGHVVMVADICENEAGEKAYLLAQGYMPAQQFHILKNDTSKEDPWYYEKKFSWPFRTPEYTFHQGSLRRMRY